MPSDPGGIPGNTGNVGSSEGAAAAEAVATPPAPGGAPVDTVTSGGAPVTVAAPAAPPTGGGISGEIDKANNIWGGEVTITDSSAAQFAEAQKTMKSLGSDLKQLEGNIKSQQVILDTMQKKLTGAEGKLGNAQDAKSKLDPDADGYGDACARCDKDIAAAQKEVDGLKGAISNIAGGIMDMRDKVGQLEKTMDNFIQQTEAAQNRSDLSQQSKDEMKNATNAAKKLKEECQSFQGTANAALGTLSPAMMTMIQQNQSQVSGAKSSNKPTSLQAMTGTAGS